MQRGLLLASSMGCNNILAEADALCVIKACNGEEACWSEAATISPNVDLSFVHWERTWFLVFTHCMCEANPPGDIAMFSHES